MSIPSRPTVFITGGTGYVGGCYLNRLLARDPKPSLITVLSRRKETFPLIEALSTSSTQVVPLHGNFDDAELLSKTAEDHDITVDAGDSDHPALVEALLNGMERRKSQGKKTIYIHVSGTGTLSDDAKGEFKGEIVYTDGKAKPPKLLHINDLPSTAFHRKIDLAIYEADKKGWCESYIILPGTVWGEAKGGVYDSGLSGRHSSQIPQQIKASLDKGQPGMVGKGLNVWAHVHIDDLGSHFDLIYTTALQSGSHGYDGNYFAVAGEYQLLEATRHMGKTLLVNGWTNDAEPVSFTEEDLDKHYAALEKIGGSKYYSGTNSRARSEQAEKLGWNPAHKDEEEFYAYVVSETERVGRESKRE